MMKRLTPIFAVLLLLFASGAQADHRWREGWGWHSHDDEKEREYEYEEERDYEYEDRRERRDDRRDERAPGRHVHRLDPLGLGPYIGLHVVGAPEAYRSSARRHVGGNRNIDGSFGFGARIGYRFLPHIAAELHTEWIEGFDLQQFRGDHSEIRTWTNTVNGKFFFGHARLQPYAMVGMGLQRAWVRNPRPGGVNFDDVAFVGRFGGGLDFHLTPHLALNLESSYLAPTGDLDDHDTVSIGLGLNYRF